jgi:hypothetical protein
MILNCGGSASGNEREHQIPAPGMKHRMIVFPVRSLNGQTTAGPYLFGTITLNYFIGFLRP